MSRPQFVNRRLAAGFWFVAHAAWPAYAIARGGSTGESGFGPLLALLSVVGIGYVLTRVRTSTWQALGGVVLFFFLAYWGYEILKMILR